MNDTITDSTLYNRINSLVSLIDDPSPVVQKHIGKAIIQYDDKFEAICQKLQIYLSQTDKEHINRLINQNNTQPIYKIGQIIKHIRYGYTGVIVDIDTKFNSKFILKTTHKKPTNTNQPWYHILVNQSDTATYAAQSSLNGNIPFQEVINPDVATFFDSVKSNYYIRNNKPWIK